MNPVDNLCYHFRKYWGLAPAFLLLLLGACSQDSNNTVTATEEDIDTTVVETFEIDIQSRLLSGNLLLDSSAYQPGDTSSYAVELTTLSNPENNVFIGYFFDEQFSISVIPGQYQPVYYYQFGNTTPVNYAELLPLKINATNDLSRDIDVATIVVNAQFLLNGNPFPTALEEVAHVYLQSNASEEQIFLGFTNSINPSVRILPGDYQVVYEYQSGETIPVNTHAILPDTLTLNSSGPIQIDMASSTVRSRFSVDGIDFPQSLYDAAAFALVNADQGDTASIGRSHQGITSTQVLYGNYDAHYQLKELGDFVPKNPDTVIEQDVIIDQPSMSLNLNVNTVEISGNFTINGVVTSDSLYENARIYLQDPVTGALTFLENTREQNYPATRIIPGNYNLVYRTWEGDSMPANRYSMFAENIAIIGGNFDINIPMINVSWNFTLNGNAFPSSLYDRAKFYLKESGTDADPDNEIFIGDTFNNEFPSINLLPGHYDLIFEAGETKGVVPVNKRSRFISNLELTASTNVSHDFITRNVKINASLNGGPFPDSLYSVAKLYLGSETEEKILMVQTHLPSEPITVLTGDYDIYYSVHETGSDYTTIPINKNAIVGSISID